MQLYSTQTKQAISLGEEIARGGEGIIYRISGDNSKLAKLYIKPIDQRKSQKLAAMASCTTNQIAQVAAWPTDLLVRQSHENSFKAIGFIMPKADSPEQLHGLYTPKSRTISFPEADLRFLLHVAANVIRAFGAVHQAGHVIGDINHGHLLVSKNGCVRLIDCDSFQVYVAGETFTCDVGSPLFTPTELQGQSFRGLTRTANHDRFGLAVLLFHMLFLGRHPYAGVPTDPRQSAEIETAIKFGRFAYGTRRQTIGINQPPGTIPLGSYGAEIASLFEAAFAFPILASRPDETTWLSAIINLQKSLKSCTNASSHQYPSHLTQCPWCVVEQKTGVRLFGTRIINNVTNNTINIDQLWLAIEAIPHPAKTDLPKVTDLNLPERTDAELKKKNAVQNQKAVALLAMAIVILAGFMGQRIVIAAIIAAVFARLMWPKLNKEEATATRNAVTSARQEYERYLDEWKRTATEKRFEEVYGQLKAQRDKLKLLPTERSKLIKELTSEIKQREQFLDRFRLANAQIPGIGSGRKATLVSFGIETAWDVAHQSIRRIPGFGQALTQSLLDWRKQYEMQFRFNPNQQPSPQDIRLIDSEVMSQQVRLTSGLQRGPSELRMAVEEASRARLRLNAVISQKYLALRLAERKMSDIGIRQ